MADHPLRNSAVSKMPGSNRSTLMLAVLVVILSLHSSTDVLGEDRTLPNIVLIVADDLGYGDLGCFGQRRLRTPRLDRLAVQGMRLTQFYAGSTVCAPSRCVLMTGQHTGHCLIRGNARVDLNAEQVTLPEVLKGAGYATGLFGKWGLGHEGSDGVPTRQGFDHFFGYLDQRHAHNFYPSFLMDGEQRFPLENVVPGDGEFGGGVATERRQYSPDLMIDRALQFVDDHRTQPFFLYFASTLPHANNEGREKGMEVPDYGEYADEPWPAPARGFAAMVSRLDRDVGRLLDRLEAQGLTDQTLVVFTSDNGPHREGGHDSDFFDSNGPLRGIKRDLYEGGVRVPTIARWPGHIAPGTSSKAVSWFADLLPTFAEVAQVPTPEKLDGVSILPVLEGQSWTRPEARPLYWEFYERGSAQAVRMGDWKLVRRPIGGNKFELYDLSTDPGETRDLARQKPEIVATGVAEMTKEHTPSDLWKIAAPRRSR